METKQKTLLPTLKEKQRYVVYNIMGDSHSSQELLLQEFNSLLGVFDRAKAGLMGISYDPASKRGIVRVDSKYVEKLKLCMGLITSLSGKPIIIDCIYVSGMLNKAQSIARGAKHD